MSSLISQFNPPASSSICSHILALHLHSFSCPGSRFICIILSRFLINALIYNICFSLGASLVVQQVKNLQCRRPQFDSCVGKIHCWKHRLPTPVFLGFPDGSAGKESACNVGDLGSTPGLGRSPGEGNSYPLWNSGLENSMDYIVHGVTKSETWLSNFHFWFTSLCMTDCRYIHILTKDPILFILWLSKVLFHCMYTLHLLYTFICWQLRLFWCPGYCK